MKERSGWGASTGSAHSACTGVGSSGKKFGRLLVSVSLVLFLIRVGSCLNAGSLLLLCTCATSIVIKARIVEWDVEVGVVT